MRAPRVTTPGIQTPADAVNKESSGTNLQLACTVLLALVTLFVCASVCTYSPADWPSPKVYPQARPAENACGVVGAWLAYQLFAAFGPGTYVVAVGLGGALAARALKGRLPNPWQRTFGLACLTTVIAAAAHLWWPISRASLPEGNGGVLGIYLARLMRDQFSWVGTGIILLYAGLMGLLFAADGLLFRAPGVVNGVGRLGRWVVAFAGRSVGGAPSAPGHRGGDPQPARTLGRVEPKINPHLPPEDRGPSASPQGKDRRDAGVTKAERKALLDEPHRSASQNRESPQTTTAGGTEPRTDRPARDETPKLTAIAPTAEAHTAGAATPPITRRTTGPSPRPYPAQLGEWHPPPISLLLEPTYRFGQQQETYVREKAAVLERTLADYRIEAQVVEIDAGPVITLYELQLAAGVKVSQITALSNDVARALKAPVVRVVSPISGKSTIGIEVPNPDKEKVRLRELMVLSGTGTQQMSLPLFLGKDASGNPLVTDLARMPHLLIAGTTGSGKSVCLNSIILSLLMTQRPDVVKMILVDPKMVELSQFRNVPHLMCPIVTEVKRAAAILDWATTTMDERYEILAEAGVRNLAAYNRLGAEEVYRRFIPASEEEKARIPVHLPHVVVIIDELADLMMSCGKEVEYFLARLAQKSRAVGIHIIVATQRPEARIVTGLVKSNLPCRIAFRVSSRLDSRIVLDQNGAEMLLGQGDMLFLPPGSSKLMRAQGTFIEDGELKGVIDYLATQAKPEYHPDLVRLPGEGEDGGGERDELFDRAVRIVLETRRGSVSLLQRRLTIGYSRASRLIDQMAAAGIVGEYKGSQAREVNMTLEEWEELRDTLSRNAGPDANDDEARAPEADGLVVGNSRPDRGSAELPDCSSGPDTPADE